MLSFLKTTNGFCQIVSKDAKITILFWLKNPETDNIIKQWSEAESFTIFKRWSEAVGTDYFLLRLRHAHSGGPSHMEIMKAIERFGRDVIPNL